MGGPSDVRAADRAAVRSLPAQDEIRLGARALAVTRVFLTIAALFVASILLSEQFGSINGLLLSYLVFAVVVLVGMLGARHVSPMLPVAVQIADLGFVAALAFSPIGGAVPFFSFLLFPLFTAASRWGFQEVMLTTIVMVVVLVIEAFAAPGIFQATFRSEEHTSELQSLRHLVCRLL